MNDIIVNYNRCLCRRTSSSTEQCRNKKKFGDYCGIHIKCYNKTGRIDQKIKMDVSDINEITIDNYINYNIHKMRMSDLKLLAKKFKLDFKKIKRKILLYELLMIFLLSTNNISKSEENLKKLTKFQTIIKSKYIRNIFGIPNINRNICSNKIDINGDLFWNNNNNKKTINTNLKVYDVFGFYENKIGYCFTVQAFIDNLKHYGKNPYTCQLFSKKTLQNFKHRNKYIEKSEYNFFSKSSKLVIPSDKINKFQAIRVFQIIDSLGNYTDYKWFTNLSVNRLKLMYFYGKDVWNYTFSNINQKKKILPPHGTAFIENYHRINGFRASQKKELQKIILDQIEKLVTKGETREDSKIGAWIVITILVKASREAQRALPYYI
jgi:hypothetical protein